MPELPEVEMARRKLERALAGKRIRAATLAEDRLVLSGIPASGFQDVLAGAVVEAAGRKGKYWWLGLKDRPALMGHLGMSGRIEPMNPGESGSDRNSTVGGLPRYAKLILHPERGRPIVFTDPRRFGRLWLAEDPARDRRIQALGPDAWLELPDPVSLHDALRRRQAPIKGLLLNQKLFAGIGNWIADEALYQAGINPSRPGATLSPAEVAALREAIRTVLDTAIAVGANKRKFPRDWLFHSRWSRGKSPLMIGGREILRETISGRTCAWVPDVQK